MMLKEYFPCGAEADNKEAVRVEEIRTIYEKIVDNDSRYIFENRLLYSLTGDYEYIRQIVLRTTAGKMTDESLHGKLYLYGAGKRGRALVETFPDKEWQGFIDVEKEGAYEGYPVHRLCDFTFEKDTKIVISNRYGYEEIKERLMKEKGVPEDRIIIFEQMNEKVRENRYFEPGCLKRYSMQNQIFLDLGCYDGIDAVKAKEFYGKEKFSVYAVEPDADSYENCKRNLQAYDDVFVINKGIGKKRESQFFVSGGEGARFAEEGNSLIEIDTIDHLMERRLVGFIKMDIEGYEEEALLGGAETIKRCKPVLAICIYHKKTDIWKLPLAVLRINPDYRFYLGHYTLNWGDTVLYAVDEGSLR